MSEMKAKQTMQLLRIVNIINESAGDPFDSPLVQIGIMSIRQPNVAIAWEIWDRMDIDLSKCSDEDFDAAAKQAMAEHFADQELTDVARDQSV